ncbi:MAG: monofunctional biosynthetic peptidoglycan transglycosylase [Alphaproteobacteria bacterium]|nr:monofunctional biosynthetic peptidoglycan transglycosylase [Alphaproteobacteria bacterium]
MPRSPVRRRRTRALRWGAGLLVTIFVLTTLLPVLLLRVVDPPGTPTMLQRVWAHHAETGRWTWVRQASVPLAAQGPWVPRMVVASEDGWFWHHHGFDPQQIAAALDDAERGKELRGASTLTQQLAKNLFLTQHRHPARKAIEAWYTVWLELLLPKGRILELYLDVAETGPMVFGFDAGARHWFGKPPDRLDALEAAQLAAILPSPRRWTPTGRTERARKLVQIRVPFPGERGFDAMAARAPSDLGWSQVWR